MLRETKPFMHFGRKNECSLCEKSKALLPSRESGVMQVSSEVVLTQENIGKQSYNGHSFLPFDSLYTKVLT